MTKLARHLYNEGIIVACILGLIAAGFVLSNVIIWCPNDPNTWELASKLLPIALKFAVAAFIPAFAALIGVFIAEAKKEVLN